MIAVVFSLLSAASLANGAVAGRAGMQGVHPVAVIGIALVVGFIGVAIAALALSPSDLFYVPRSVLLWIVVFGVVQFAVGRTSAYTGLSTIGASRVALFISIQVPFAAFFAIAFTGESLGILVAVGTVAVMLGLLLSSGDSLTTGWRTDRRYLIGCLARADGGGSHRGQHGPGQAGRQRIQLTADHHGAVYAGGNVHCGAGRDDHRFPKSRRPCLRQAVDGLHLHVRPEHHGVHRCPALCGTEGRCADSGPDTGHLSAVDAAAFPYLHLPAGTDNPAAHHRGHCRGGRRDCGGAGRAAMTTSIAFALALTLSLSQGERQFALPEGTTR